MQKNILQFILKIISQIIIAKYQPKVIGITGSIGKTSTKEAVHAVLKNEFNTRRSIKNYNNEIGLPLTIIGMDSPGKSFAGWFFALMRGAKLIFFKDKNYPRILILEMGVDRPGDMEYLLKIVRPDIGILTYVGSVHQEFFASKEKLRQEKAKLISGIKDSGRAIINFDNEEACKSIAESRVSVFNFGLNEGADLRAVDIRFCSADTDGAAAISGVSFLIKHDGFSVPVFLPSVLGLNAVYAALAACAVGIVLGLDIVKIAEALKAFIPPKGRANLIRGIKNTLIIDDTYNSGPQSALAALGILKRLPTKHERIAVLGDMLELGADSENCHREIGKCAVALGINKLILVGERARDIGRGAVEAGLSQDAIFHFPFSEDAGIFIQDRIRQGDIILVKGSQGTRMEKIVREIMAEPLRAAELLVRQEKEWLK